MGKRDIKARIRVALAKADPIGTELSLEERMDEYSLEAGQIARKIVQGETLEKAASTVFRDTCHLELSRVTVRNIVAEYEAASEKPAA